MKAKVKKISDDLSDGIYLIFFIHAQSNNIIFLSEDADIDAICYASDPILSGTINPMLAKKYIDIEEAKKDIYKLRYHHREFLKVITGIKKMSKIDLYVETLVKKDVETYKIIDLT